MIGQFAWGWWMQEIPKQPVGPRVDAFNLHKSVGMTIFALMVVRLAVADRPSASAAAADADWQAALARLTHVVLYAALLIQPLAGYLGSEWSGYPVKYFGIDAAGMGGQERRAEGSDERVHLVTSWVIAAVVTLHVAGALKHALIDRDRLLARMGIGRGGPG